jgi:hypothetical protein
MNHIQNARNVIDIEIEALREGKEAIGQEFEDAIEHIRSRPEHGRVVVMGIVAGALNMRQLLQAGVM